MSQVHVTSQSASSGSSVDDAIVSPVTYAEPSRSDALFADLRAHEPVRWTQPQGFRPFWTVTRHADIRAIEGDPEHFANAPRLVLRSIALEDQVKALTGGRTLLLRNLVNLDGGEHRALRVLTQAWFMPPRLKALETDLKRLAGDHMDLLAARDGAADFVQDVASWYPLRVIMSILGLPAEDEPKILKLTQQIFGPDDPDVKTDPSVNVVTTVDEFTAYFTALTAARRASPTNDVASLIANAVIDGVPIGDLEALSYYVLIATAGHDTTGSTIAGGLLALIQHPAQMRRLRDDPALLPRAVDEMVRWVTPVKHFFRTALEDAEVGGQRVRKGDSLLMCYASANRDAEAFDDPFAFDVARPQSRHLAFGYGPHLCLGQHLAKLEIRLFFEALLARFDDFILDGDPAWVASNFVSGLKRLPIRYRAV
ncbi:MAG TPA: cytochrome P450 [Caulobacteraceae bacterium]